MKLLIIAAASFILDLLFGDPSFLPHPVVLMGKAISRLEYVLRKKFPETPAGERSAGRLLALLLPLGSVGISALSIGLLNRFAPSLGFALSVFWGWQSLALKGLKTESERVFHALQEGSLEDARSAVGRIVGRDTAVLDRRGVIRAAVETVAENFSDGVMAPLCFLMLGGAPLALGYKAINTMDSMVGYKNTRYLHFGRAAAKLDDAANFIPSRLSALLLILAAALCGEDAGGAAAMWRRDRRNHASPNSAQTESAMAGALGLQLGGPASYFGKMLDKPTIGDPLREAKPEDIRRANRLLVAGSVLGLILLGSLRAIVSSLGGAG